MTPTVMRLSLNATPELGPAALALTKKVGGFTTKDPNANVASTSGKEALSAFKYLAPRSELLLMELQQSKLKNSEWSKTLADLADLAATSHFTQGRITHVNSRDVGSVYRYQRTYAVWATPLGAGWLQTTPDVRTFSQQTRWHEMGATAKRSEGGESKPQGLGGLSHGEWESLIGPEATSSLALWQRIHGPMPPMVWGEALKRPRSATLHPFALKTELSAWWLAWAMGYPWRLLNGVAPVQFLTRASGLFGSPYMALWGWSLCLPDAPNAMSQPSLF